MPTESKFLHRLKTYVILVQYNGSLFYGSQIQKVGRTVQGILEEGLKVYLKVPTLKVVLSGRTDSGVSSEGSVAHFQTTHFLQKEHFLNAINAILPQDIAILDAQTVEEGFHSVRSSVYKWYRYTILNHPMNNIYNTPKLIFKRPLDVKAMNDALALIHGEHNFQGFASAKASTKYHVCRIILSTCRKNGFEIYIDIVGNRFLYNMVRIIVGTLLKIGTGDLPVSSMLSILSKQDRTLAGPTVHARGLCLKWIFYPENYAVFTRARNRLLDEFKDIKQVISMEFKINENVCG